MSRTVAVVDQITYLVLYMGSFLSVHSLSVFMPMSRGVVLLILLASVAFSNSILIVVDASGSMDDPLPSGEIKIDAAKLAAKNFIDSSQGSELAVMRFSYCGDRTPDPSKGDIRIVQQLTTNKQYLKNAIDSISVAGDTPIAAALDEAVEYFRQNNRKNGIIILLTDGEETCNGDPVSAARTAYEHGYAVINIIAYNLSSEGLRKAEAIAQAGGGKMYSAENQRELEQAFAQASAPSSQVCALPAFVFAAIGCLAAGRIA